MMEIQTEKDDNTQIIDCKETIVGMVVQIENEKFLMMLYHCS